MLFDAGKDAVERRSDVGNLFGAVSAQHHSVHVLRYEVVVEVSLHVLLVLLELCPRFHLLFKFVDILRLTGPVALLQQLVENFVKLLLAGAVLVDIKGVY